MAEYPKTFAKNGIEKLAHNARQEVALKFDGYRLVEQSASVEEAPAEEAEATTTEDQDAADEPTESEPKPKSTRTHKN